MENRLSNALQAREFFLVFQPIVKIETNQTIELDINLRWQVEEYRIAYPSQFLSVIDDIGLLPDLYDWIIDTTLSSLRRWNQEGIKIYLNLNLSLKYLLQPSALDFLADRLKFYNIDPNFIFISITEQDVIKYSAKLDDIDQKLANLGISILLDDFGQSEASIKNLRRLKFHSVKLDRSLIRDIENTDLDAHIIEGIISLINQMNMGSIAKGVENEKQLELIKSYQCQYAQGYLLGDPMNENQTRQFLLEN
ncbi:MAG: EAL domain-containing protein [Enterobacterales bacterium]|nr:EAL domain-containing protein [Enterobacterales bacterium]